MLSIIGEIMLKVLSKDDLDAKMKATRDQFFDTLEVGLILKYLKTKTSTIE